MAWSSIASTSGRLCAIAALTAVVACGDDGAAATGATEGVTVDDPTTGTSAAESTSTGGDESTGAGSWTGTSTGGPDPSGSGGMTGEPPPDLEMICTSLLTRNAEAVEGLCLCDVEAGVWPDLAACMAFNGVDPQAISCECSIYADYPELSGSFACLDAAAAAYLECVAPHACAASAAREACLIDYTTATDACPQMNDNAAAGEVAIVCGGEAAYMCMDGAQVPESWVCDLEPDCADASDESSCPTFMCGSGEAVPPMWQCDGMEDCMDGSDEAGCPTFMCGSGETIPEAWRCDGYQDCLDSSDEAGCPTFMCGSGETIPESWRCDGEPDCLDDSDEMGCG